ncbi:MAG: FecR domain-containing protein [Candidatus Margulisiibacteriota bacterium]
MTNHITPETISNFLNGRIDSAVSDMLLHIKTCPECKREFDLSLMADELLLSKGQDKSDVGHTLSNAEWDAAFDNAWEKSNGKQKQTHKVIRFHRAFYALAASIIILIGGYIALKPVPTAENKVAAIIIPETKHHSQSNVSRQVRISHHTSALVSAESDINLTQNTDSLVSSELTMGSALFSVEPHHYKSFKVNTPDAEITVTGTVFDVLISENVTRVSVIRGSVSVFYKSLKEKIMLSKDEAAIPDKGHINIKHLTPEEKAAINANLDKITSSILEDHQTPLRRIAEQVPKVPFEMVLEQKLNLGLQSLGKNDFSSAQGYFSEVKSSGLKNSTVQTAYFESSLLQLNKLGNVEEGVKGLEEYLNLFDNGLYTEEALVELVSVNRKLGKTDKVIQYEKKYASAFMDKNYSRDFVYEAATLLRETKKDYQEAAGTYAIFIERYSRDYRIEDAIFWMGKCHWLAENKARARVVYSDYLKKYPEGRWVSEIKSILQQ